MIALMLRPRLIVYNISLDQLRPILAETVEQIDPGVRWAGDSLTLPGLGVHLYIDNHPAMRNVALVSAGSHQDHAGWRRLDAALASALARVDAARNPRGISLLTTGLFILGVLSVNIVRDPKTIARSLFDLLQM